MTSLDVHSVAIGLDEAGKGDYFGPLVVAALAASQTELEGLNIVESKKISDRRAIDLAAELHTRFAVEVVAVLPPKYNELYAKFRNLNALLAWCHSRALENLLARVPSAKVIADQFAAPHVLKKALMERGREAEIVQQHRAETHSVVAAASVVARAEFLTRLQALARKWNVDLPKGAGAPVDMAARKVWDQGGKELLGQVAKLHFKNTQKIGVTL